MEYTKGRIGRVFVLKFSNDDIIIDEIKRFAKKEKVKTATITCIGALKDGCIVTGPKKAVIPPDANWTAFKDAWETIGIGTIFAGKDSPQVHLHVSMGKKNKTLTGCVRKSEKVFCVIEAIVCEIIGTKASKGIDPKTGLNMLKVR